jgi:hypothetical protein
MTASASDAPTTIATLADVEVAQRASMNTIVGT